MSFYQVMSIIISTCGVFTSNVDKAQCHSYLAKCVVEKEGVREIKSADTINQCVDQLNRSLGIYTF